MTKDAKGIFAALACVAAAAAALAGWLVIVNAAPTYVIGAVWTVLYCGGLSIVLFALVGQGNPVAGYRWMVSSHDNDD